MSQSSWLDRFAYTTLSKAYRIIAQPFGNPVDSSILLVGDLDGDSKTDTAMFDAALFEFFITESRGGSPVVSAAGGYRLKRPMHPSRHECVSVASRSVARNLPRRQGISRTLSHSVATKASAARSDPWNLSCIRLLRLRHIRETFPVKPCSPSLKRVARKYGAGLNSPGSRSPSDAVECLRDGG